MAGKEISEIHIRAGHLIDHIEFLYRDGSKATHGGDGGHVTEPFVLLPGEKLISIKVQQGASLDGCQFFLDSGRSSQWYGGRGGNSGSFEGSQHNPILDIRRATQGFCPRIIDVVLQTQVKFDLSSPFSI